MKKITAVLILAFLAVGFVSCNTTSWRTATVSVDRHPTLTIVNRTGHAVRISSPGSGNVAEGAFIRFNAPSQGGGQFYVEHFIGEWSWSQQVTVTNDTTVTLTERPPVITVINNTGFPVNITSPFQQSLANGARFFHPKQSRATNPLHTITYTVGGIPVQLNEQVTINNDDVTLTLTRRPPGVTVVNNTGHPIVVTSPFQQSLANGARGFHLMPNRTTNPVTYMVGGVQFSEQLTINDDDITLTLTRSPPNITIVNNTGVTIVNVFIRTPGTPWGALNLLGIQLNPDGSLINLRPPPGALAGSLTNMDRFTFWTGHLASERDIQVGHGVFDIRLDDTHGVSYVMNNVAIPGDRTLTFTQAHRP